LQRAQIVFYTTEIVKAEIIAKGILDEKRLIKAPYGIAPEYRPHPLRDVNGKRPKPVIGDAPFLLHVGTCVSRKRIDVLLDVFAFVRNIEPALKLIQIGGEWSTSQRAQIGRLGIADSVIQMGRQDRETVAEAYRRALLVLMPSENEGFGLPLVEAIACGSTVIASDIPVFREVGQNCAVYCRLGDIGHWTETIVDLLHGKQTVPTCPEGRLRHAQRYSWESQASTILRAYLQL
jgi:glycosyltransferase involved in cell wall biosynthesis